MRLQRFDEKQWVLFTDAIEEQAPPGLFAGAPEPASFPPPNAWMYCAIRWQGRTSELGFWSCVGDQTGGFTSAKSLRASAEAKRGRFKLGVTARGTANASGGGPSIRLNENRGDGFVPALRLLGRFFGWRWRHHVPGVGHVLPVAAVLDDDAHVGADKVLVASVG